MSTNTVLATRGSRRYRSSRQLAAPFINEHAMEGCVTALLRTLPYHLLHRPPCTPSRPEGGRGRQPPKGWQRSTQCPSRARRNAQAAVGNQEDEEAAAREDEAQPAAAAAVVVEGAECTAALSRCLALLMLAAGEDAEALPPPEALVDAEPAAAFAAAGLRRRGSSAISYVSGDSRNFA